MKVLLKGKKVVPLALAVGLALVAVMAFTFGLTDAATVDLRPLTGAPPVQIWQHGPDTTFAGDLLTYTVWVTNVSAETVSDWTLRDTWSTKLSDDRAIWWTRGVLAEFYDYVADPPGAVLSMTHALYPSLKRGEALFTMAPLAPEQSIRIVLTMRTPITVQPSLAEHEPFRQIMGPTSMENVIIALVPGKETAEAPLVTSMVLGPVLRMRKTAEGEVAGPNECRVGRLLTYTIELQNLLYDGSRERTDTYPAKNLVVTERLPDGMSLAYISASASEPGVAVQYNSTAGTVMWEYPHDYQLLPGQSTYLTFTLRVPPDRAIGSQIGNRRANLTAQADAMPHHPASAFADLNVRVLGPFDKVVETASLPSGENQTFPKRVITYTLTFYNPYHNQTFSDLKIEDTLPAPFSYMNVITGAMPDDLYEEGRIIEWREQPLPANGQFQVTYAAFVPAQTTPNACTGFRYYSALRGSTESGPFVYLGDNSNRVAEVRVIAELVLQKSVAPSLQHPGELVTYTLGLKNNSDRDIPAYTTVTDTLPMQSQTMYFSYYAMAEPGVPPYEPTSVMTNVVVWSTVPTVTVGETFRFRFSAVVDGHPTVRYGNNVHAYNPETAICPLLNAARVTVDSPIKINKEALVSPVVQGEMATYRVLLYNNSPSTAYNITHLFDNLNSVQFTNPADGSAYYIYTATQPIPLAPRETWEHHFDVIATGAGLRTTWCEDRGRDRNLEQAPGSVSVIFDDPPLQGANANKLAPMKVIPHISLYQQAYPNPVAIGSTAVLTLLLQDNRILNPTPTTGITLAWTNPSGAFSVTESSLPFYVVGNVYYWEDLVVPAGGQTMVTATLLAPATVANADESRNYSLKAEVVAIDDPAMCIPSTTDALNVRRGIQIEKTRNLPEVAPYNEVIYTLRARNLTGAPVAGVVLTDVLPFGWQFVDMVAGPEPESEDPLIWRLDTIPAGAFWETRFKVRAYTELGLRINEVIGEAPINIGYSANYTKNVEVMVISGIGLFKEVEPRMVDTGDTVVYTLTLYNGTGVAIRDTVVVDKLPPGFSYVEGVAMPAVPVTGVVGGREVMTWTMGVELPPAQSRRFVFRVRVGEDLPTGYYFNEASGWGINKTTGRVVEFPATGPTAKLRVQGIPTVQATKSVMPSAVDAGEEVTYTITILNEVDETLSLIVTDTLPTDFEFVSSVDLPPSAIWPGTRPRIVWQDLSIEPQQTLQITFRARPKLFLETGSYCNQIQVQANQVVQPPSLPIACVNVTQIPRVDAQVAKDDGVEVAQSGQVLLYTIVYTNAESSEVPLHNVVITETVTPVEYVVAAGGAGWTYIGEGQYTYEVGSLAPGESGQVSFEVTLADEIPETVLSLRNEAEIGYTTDKPSVDIEPANNRAVDVNVLNALFKTVSPPAIDAGWDVIYTITLHNSMEQAWTGAVITDILPAGFTFQQVLVGPVPTVQMIGQQQHLVWPPATLPGDSVLTRSFRATVGLDVPTGDYPNQALAHAVSSRGVEFEAPPTGPTAPVAVRGAPAVQIDKVVAPTAITAGETVVYTITITSAEEMPVTVVLTDVLPLHFYLVEPITPTTIFPLPGVRQLVYWPAFTLNPSESVEFVFEAQSDVFALTDPYCNGVQARVDDFLYPVLELACVDLTGLYARVDAQVSLHDGVHQVIPRDTITYTIYYTNAASSETAMHNVILTQTLTPSDALVAVDPAWTQVAGGVYTYSVGTLEPGDSGSVVLVGQVNPALSPDVVEMGNLVEIGYTTTVASIEYNPADNQALDINTVLHGPDLIVTHVRLRPNLPIAGSPLAIYVTMKNQGTLPAERWDGSGEEGWHYVTGVYLRTTPTPPENIFDHSGETCLAWGGVLAPGESLEIVCEPYLGYENAPEAGSYFLYAQADVSWEGDPPWDQPFGLIQETREGNNIYAGGRVFVSTGDVYLPVVLRNSR